MHTHESRLHVRTPHIHTQAKVQHMLDLLLLIEKSASAFGVCANLNSKIVQGFAKFSQIHCLMDQLVAQWLEHLPRSW